MNLIELLPGRQRLLLRAAVLSGLLLAFFAPQASAQPNRTGAIAGVVSNAATNQYLDEAEVKVDGTKRSVLTSRDGSYIITGLEPGTHNLTVSYAGLDVEKRAVTVTAGQTA